MIKPGSRQFFGTVCTTGLVCRECHSVAVIVVAILLESRPRWREPRDFHYGCSPVSILGALADCHFPLSPVPAHTCEHPMTATLGDRSTERGWGQLESQRLSAADGVGQGPVHSHR